MNTAPQRTYVDSTSRPPRSSPQGDGAPTWVRDEEAIVQLAVTASSPPLRAPLRGGFASLNPAVTRTEFGTCEGTGKISNTESDQRVKQPALLKGGTMLTNIAAFSGAAAALLAAVFSGISLYLAGRREERRWRRDALLKCYQRFIELSFDRSLIAVKSIQTRRADVPPQVRGVFNLDELRIQEDQLHTEYDSLITRLRLMGVRDVIDAAETLHVRDNQLVDLGWASDIEFKVFEEKREQNRRAKEAMLGAARATLGLEPMAVIADQYWSPTEQKQ